METMDTEATQTAPAGPACEAPDLDAADAVVVARGVTREYGEGDAAVHALRGVDVDLARGHLTAIMGPSGSGKSTLMHILAGLDEPTSGTVVVDGIEITSLKERELTQLRRDKIGFIFQTFNLLPTLTAQENIELPMTIAGRKGDGKWVGQLIDTVGLADRLDHKPAELSGGQQQRVAVARALVDAPRGRSSPTSRPATSTRRPATTCFICCAGRSRTSARRSSWSRTTPTPPRSPTACSSCTTARSSTTAVAWRATTSSR